MPCARAHVNQGVAILSQVSVGGQNVLNSTLNMTYENFLEQLNLAEQLASSDFVVSTGLISQ